MQDVWQLGVLVYVLLTGQLPWQKADLTDPHYNEYITWRKRRSLRTPKRFANFTSRFLRMLKRLLEPKPEKRAGVLEACKYIDDRWLVRAGGKLGRRDLSDIDGQSVCYSTFSTHSCPREKDRVLGALKAHGIETTVDRVAKRQRIHEWLERSVGVPPPPAGPRGEIHAHPRPMVAVQASTHAHKQAPQPPGADITTTRKQYQQFAALALKVAHAHAHVHDDNHNTRMPPPPTPQPPKDPAPPKRHSQGDDEDVRGRGRGRGALLPLQRSRTDSYLLDGAPRHDHSKETSPESDDSGASETPGVVKASVR